MALSPQNQNIVIEIIQAGEALKNLHNQMASIILRFNENNVYNEASDSELLATPNLAHLTQSNLGNAIAGFIALQNVFEGNNNQHLIAFEKLKG